MSFDGARVRFLLVGGALFAAAAANACLSDDTAVPKSAPGLTYDAGPGFPFDAGPPSEDAGADAGPTDSGSAHDAGAIADAGRDASVPTQVGLVGGGTVGHSAHYTMTGTLGPATAPVLRSPKYQVVGGMAVTGKNP